jgi:AcrR family transcriptional regulator
METGQPRAETGEKQTAILAAARDILAEGGLDALSMRAVAARVGTTPTAIYHYFEGKDDLVGQVVAHGFRQSEVHLWKAVERFPKGSIDRLAALGEAYIRFAMDHRPYFTIIFGIGSEEPRRLDEVPGRGGYGVMRQCVVDAIENGTIRPGDPDTIVLYLWSIVHGLVTIALAFDSEAMLKDTAITVPDDESAPRHLYRSFRQLIEHGLVPTAEVKA